MFDSEEVDNDYFTPVAKTSLSSIFTEPASGEKSENESLKYTPSVPRPVQSHEEPPKPARSYETIFSCVFDAYLWLNNVYTNRGKLGCAVVKHNTTEGSQSFHSILLYDSKRATVASAIAAKELEVTVKGNTVISFYDRNGKYWCLHGSENDIKKNIDALKMCNVNIKILSDEKINTPTQQNNSEEFDVKMNTRMKNIESDTDSSINRKTKASILSRMANMGQSVLPPRTVSNEQSSDSSDAKECESQLVAVRHKPVKNVTRKNLEVLDHYKKTDAQYKAIAFTAQQQENTKLTGIDNQIMPIQSSVSIASTSGQDLNYFFTEQRIANSELRINMSRVNDKVDDILNKVHNLEKNKCAESAINTEIYQKLLKEYESKIKTYEELLLQKANNSISKQDLITNIPEKNDLVELNNKISELNNSMLQKDAEISALNKEIKKLKEVKASQNEDQLQGKISEYKEMHDRNNATLLNLTMEKGELLKKYDHEIESKVKSIMNNTYRSIEVNFDDAESYSGEAIKHIIAAVIKRITIESLKQNQ